MTDPLTPFRPDLTFSEKEAALIRDLYCSAEVILEYGSGGSTVLASELSDKLIFSVESDRDWALNLQHYIDVQALPSPAIIYYANIGPVGAWGRPVDTRKWQRFHHYPQDIWDQPYFRHPDVVLIDGRFRAACLAITRLKITRPVTVLFDDYVDRPAYHAVERLTGKPRIVGRMAVFELMPAQLTAESLGDVMALMTQATYVKRPRYDV